MSHNTISRQRNL